MSSNASIKVPRWKWVVLSHVVVGALAMPVTIIYLQHRLSARPNDVARPWEDPVLGKKLSDARLVKAKTILAEWHPWALKHKTQLRAMLASQGQDFAALQSVYKASPPLKKNDWKPDSESGPVKFGWYTDIEKMVANGNRFTWFDAKSQAIFESQKGQTLEKLKKEFAAKSDFTVASSLNPGTITEIWASGRVTEKRWIPNPAARAGQPAVVEAPDVELLPPFDFLTSADAE